jgi:hypothetical protein
MSGRLIPWGHSGNQPPATRDVLKYAPRDSILIPSDPPFERSKIAQALIDCFAVAFAAFLLSVTGIGIAASFFILLFVQT